MSRWIARALKTVGSPRFAALLVVVWAALIVVWVIPFEFYGLPVAQLRSIVYREDFFRAMYILLAASTLACMGLRLTAISRRIRRTPAPSAVPRLPEDAGVSAHGFTDDQASAALAAAGFGGLVVGDGWVWGVRRRWSPVGSILLHAAVLVLMVAGLYAVMGPSPFTGEAVVAIGETFTGRPESWVSIEPAGVRPPEISFTVDDVSADFYRDILLFTRLEVAVKDAAGTPRLISLASPWVSGPDGLVAIKDFGYSLDVRRSTPASTSPVRTYKLKVFPSEITDSFEAVLGTQKYKVYVRVYGDYVDRAGKPGVRSFNLTNPRIAVTVKELLSSKVEVERVTEQLIEPGDSVALPEGRIIIDRISRHAVFRITRVPAAPIIGLALLMAVVGAWIRLVVPRQEATIVDDRSGTVRIAVADDTYRRDRAAEARLLAHWEETS